MVSSFGLHHRNQRTLAELLRIHPAEHPVSIQLFGHDPMVMGSAAEIAAGAGADLIDINMGCPVRKVCRTGSGAALLRSPELAVQLVEAAIDGSGRPVTVKLRSGFDAGDSSGLDLAVELAEAGAAAIALHPRSAVAHHQGKPDHRLVAQLVERLAGSDTRVIATGGLASADAARLAYAESGADAVMIARGALGNPWIFEQLTGTRSVPPTRDEVVEELLWTMERIEDHLGPERGARYARKFYPWYLERLGIRGPAADAFQRTDSLEQARRLLAASPAPLAVAA
jgi:nifR3 family TIM-barrel protein